MLKELIKSIKKKFFKEKQLLNLKLDLKKMSELNMDLDFVEFRKKPDKQKFLLYNLTKATEKNLLKEL